MFLPSCFGTAPIANKKEPRTHRQIIELKLCATKVARRERVHTTAMRFCVYSGKVLAAFSFRTGYTAKGAGCHDMGSQQLPLARVGASRGAVNAFYDEFVDELAES